MSARLPPQQTGCATAGTLPAQELIKFKHSKEVHQYRRYQGAIPDGSASIRDGDLARISDTEWQTYSADAGGWITAEENSQHPTLKDVRLSGEGLWVNRRTITEQRRKKRKAEDDPELESSRHAAPKCRQKRLVSDDMVDPSVGPVVTAAGPEQILPQNRFLLALENRWRQPLLSYYSMVSEKTIAVLGRLARWPSALTHHKTFPIPPCEQPPHSACVIEDLLAMGEDLINFHELCAQDSTPKEPVSTVVDMLFKSHLTAPWRTGQRIVAMSNIAATDKGMLRCKLDWSALVSQLGGTEFAFGDYQWMYTPEELGKIFPPTSANSAKSGAKRIAYLKTRGDEPWVASVRTPPGWVSDMHTDMAGLAQAIVHCDGEKVWLFWPATNKNLRWWDLQHPQPWVGHPSRLEEALDALEGLEIMHVTQPCAFIVPPFCIHAVIAFQGSTHTCVSFAHATHWEVAKEGLELCKRLVHNAAYPATSAMELVEKVIHETPIWERAMGADSVAATYLARWKEDTAAIYEKHKSRNISSA